MNRPRFEGPKEYISPLLQPPLNRLFVPRPTPQYLSPIDRDSAQRKWVKADPVARQVSLLQEPVASLDEERPPILTKKEKVEAKRRKAKQLVELQFSECDLPRSELDY